MSLVPSSTGVQAERGLETSTLFSRDLAQEPRRPPCPGSRQPSHPRGAVHTFIAENSFVVRPPVRLHSALTAEDLAVALGLERMSNAVTSELSPAPSLRRARSHLVRIAMCDGYAIAPGRQRTRKLVPRALTCGNTPNRVERVTRIELAFSAWEGENRGLDETHMDGIGRVTCSFPKRRMSSDCVRRRWMCHRCAMEAVDLRGRR